ncbi:hypothetical protein [Desulfomonile tiedjei]|uniref:Uncharacterized protein n=1 Tax=Desulfomonile tiedjei (strain ATCC 49306 / DSM 6799 / DCB-1) TaxID=706587 RepID=I4C9B7_DESTA|nr:hypothetical protein [Desulfomonile tiedjei]AFM26158.1 hypothetical protein Desti_3507 [Desulfomonile tiedjei DSM 6799]
MKTLLGLLLLIISVTINMANADTITGNPFPVSLCYGIQTYIDQIDRAWTQSGIDSDTRKTIMDAARSQLGIIYDQSKDNLSIEDRLRFSIGLDEFVQNLNRGNLDTTDLNRLQSRLMQTCSIGMP